MIIEKFRFTKTMAQMKRMEVPKIENNIVYFNGYEYHYTTFKNGGYDYITVKLNSVENFELIFRIDDKNVEILESIYNGKKCKSDRTLKKFEKIVGVFYPLYELKRL